MKRSFSRLGSLLVLLLGLFIIYALWVFQPRPAIRKPKPKLPPQVEVLVLMSQPFQVTVQTQGIIKPVQEINLVTQVAGRVTQINKAFQVGNLFEANNTLVSLDDRDYRYALVEAKSQVAVAERELALEKGQSRQAKREWRDLGSEEANALFLRKPQLRAAQAALESALAAQQQAQLNLERTTISVPFAGAVLEKRVGLGQYLSPGTVVGTVYESAKVEVRLPLSNKQLALSGLDLRNPAANEVEVLLSTELAGTTQQWQAQLVRFDTTVDRTTRFFHVIAQVSEPFNTKYHSKPLLVGLFVKAQIPGLSFPVAYQIPERAVVSGEVFIVDDNNQLQALPVEIISREQELLWVKSQSLQEGNRLVVSEPKALRPGLSVRVLPAKGTP